MAVTREWLNTRYGFELSRAEKIALGRANGNTQFQWHGPDNKSYRRLIRVGLIKIVDRHELDNWVRLTKRGRRYQMLLKDIEWRERWGQKLPR